MYQNDGSLDLPSIYRGLPIDKETLYWEPIVDSEGNVIDEVLKARGGEGSGGVADSVAWVNVYGKPAWLSDDKINYSEITGTPDLTVYALKTQIPSLSGYATENWVLDKDYATNTEVAKKWNKDDTKIADWDAAFSWGNHAVAGYVKKEYVDSTFVTIAGNEDVTGFHNFINGLKINGIELKYDTDNNAIYIEKSDGTPVNFYTTGAISMYGIGNTKVSTIMDAIEANLDENTLAITNGKLTVIGGTGSGGIAEITKQMVIDALEFTPYSAANPNGYITAASIPSALKNPYALTFGSKTYDGSSAQSITASDLGAALSSDLSKYLPLSGGTINGIIYLNHTLNQNSRISFKNNRTEESSSWAVNIMNATDVSSNVMMRFGIYGTAKVLDYIFLGHNTYTGDNLRIYTDKVTFGSNTIWHAGNFNPANYLPLSGGTISGKLIITNSDFDDLLTIRRISADGNVVIKYANSSEVLGHIGLSGPAGLYPYEPYFRDKNGKGYKIWHSGNGGSESGLDADLLDGLQPSELSVYSSLVLKSNSDKNIGYELRYCSGTIKQGEAVGCEWVSPTGNYTSGENKVEYAAILRLGRTSTYYNDLFFNMNTGTPQWRQVVNGAHKGWRTFAFTDSNVASATKLQTARTIWGQSFDGTADVTGPLQIPNDNTLRWINNAGTDINCMYLSNENKFFIGNGVAEKGYDTYLSGNNIIFRYGTSRTEAMRIVSSGNVGVGITPEYKFHVEQKTDNTFASVFQTPNSKVYLAHSSGRGMYASVLSGVSTSYLLSLKYNQTTLGSGGSSALYVRTDGNIGIGTESPAYKLDVNGIASVKRLVITATDSVKQLAFSRVGGNSITTPEGGYLRIITNGKALGDNTADLMVNNGLVTINGNILATGGVTMQSQRSLKNVVDERGLSLTELSAIKPTRYTWKDKRDDRLHIGGIADDIEKVLPEVIYTTADGTLTMDYGNAGFAIASSLIKPVVDHEARIAALEKENKELKEQLNRLSA